MHGAKSGFRRMDGRESIQLPRLHPTERVKIGTYTQAKGLEFKAVFLPGVSAGRELPRDAASEEELEERRALELSRVFVAITRARDVLVLSCVGEPMALLMPALDSVEVVDA